MTVLDSNIYNMTVNIASNSSSRACMVVDSEMLDSFFFILKQRIHLHLLKEVFGVAFKALHFPKYHIVFDSFNRRLKQLFEGGFIQLWTALVIRAANITTRAEEGPAMLTMNHLGAGFLTWLVVLSISSTAFLVEIIVFYRKNIYEAVLSVPTSLVFKATLRAFNNSFVQGKKLIGKKLHCDESKV